MKLGKFLREEVGQKGGGKAAMVATAQTMLREGKIDFGQDFSLLEMAVAFCGENWYEVLSRHRGRAMTDGFLPRTDRHGNLREDWLRETAGSVDPIDPSAFYAITGQLLVDRIRQRYESAVLMARNLCTVEPIANRNLGTQKEPGLSRILDRPSQLQPGMPYPAGRFSPDYVELPAPAKFGEVLYITFEMIYSDLTRQAEGKADDMADLFAENFEELVLRVLLGITNPFSWNGTTYNTYQTASPWINKVTGVTVATYTDLDTIIQLARHMRDPYTGKPIRMNAMQVLAMPGKSMLLNALVGATQVRLGIYPTSGVNTLTDAPNPLNGRFTDMYISDWAEYLLTTAAADGGGGVSAANAKEYVYVGDFKRAIVYREVYPFKPTEAPAGNWFEFSQDVMLAIKGSMFGGVAVREPRLLFLSLNA